MMTPTTRVLARMFLPALCLFALAPLAQAADRGGPGCAGDSAQQCLARAIDAMGGEARLKAVHNIELEGLGFTRLPEQSYRQQPFQTSYQRFHQWLDLAGKRLHLENTMTWPQAGGTAPTEIANTLVVTPEGGQYSVGKRHVPAPDSARRDARAMLALDPTRLLLTAKAAQDLHFEAPRVLHGVDHAVLAFTRDGMPVEILLDPYNHLPDAVDSTRTFDDFWYAWGDVRQRVCFDNWILVDGVSYPSTRVELRNGLEWRSDQSLTVRFNVPLDGVDLAVSDAARKPAGGSRWQRPFKPTGHVQLAAGVDLYQGAWNATIIRQDQGLLVLEAPISPSYTQGVLAHARQQYPGQPVIGVLSTSDAWPHAGGVRQAVAEGLPVYALDLNLPLLRRLVSAPHTLHPDALARHPRLPEWHTVSSRQVIGQGDNRVELYPLRGADTGRQYMVYFPAHKLLYASDTLVIDGKTGALYQPELMHEVMQAVARAHLDVRTVFAMHQGPTPWSTVVKLVEAARKGAAGG